jgi:hypothetical protein
LDAVKILKPETIIRWHRAGFRAWWRWLDVAPSKRDEACGPGHAKSIACKIRQAEVTKPEAAQVQATAKVVAQARP